MSNLSLIKTAEPISAECVEVLEELLEIARSGRMMALAVGYMVDCPGADPDIEVDSVGSTVERIACAATSFRYETDPDAE